MLAAILIFGLMMWAGRSLQSVQANADIAVLSHTGYVDSYGYYHVIGELLNTGDTALAFVNVKVILYDSESAEITDNFDLTMLNVVLANRKSPFDIVLQDPQQSAMVDHYSINVTYSETNPTLLGLQILTDASHFDETGSMLINGTLENIGQIATTNIKIVATYYDEKGEVVAATMKHLDLEDPLPPSQTIQFEILLTDERAQFAHTYELIAESHEYSMVPEFSLPVAILLFATTAMTILIIRPNRKLPVKWALVSTPCTCA
jgi:hypothetical protein